MANAAARVVLLGRPCASTAAAGTALRQAGIALAGVILAAPPDQADAELQPGDDVVIHRASSPASVQRALGDARPDLVIAACYPWRLGRRARAHSRSGVLNIHPSLLPQGRGPEPVFWAYRHGARETGVTVHLMDDGLDAGPILAQQRATIPDGLDAVTLEYNLFVTGANLAASLAPAVLAGRAPGTPQVASAASYQPAPAASDWIISTLLPAAWAWRFTQGVAPLGGPLAVHTQERLVPVRRALAWAEDGEPPADLPPGALTVRFRPGWVAFEPGYTHENGAGQTGPAQGHPCCCA